MSETRTLYIFLFLILLVWYISTRIESFQISSPILSNQRWCVLLTTCRRQRKEGDPQYSDKYTDDKDNYYKRSIELWLSQTDLPIFVVESSGQGFPEFAGSRLKVHTVDITNLKSSSQYEARSILSALDAFKSDMAPYTHVLKVTGRYYVDVEYILPTIPDVDLVVQSRFEKDWNNSELFGIKKDLMKELLMPIYDEGLMEKQVYTFSTTHTTYRLPQVRNILMARRGGDNLLLDYF